MRRLPGKPRHSGTTGEPYPEPRAGKLIGLPHGAIGAADLLTIDPEVPEMSNDLTPSSQPAKRITPDLKPDLKWLLDPALNSHEALSQILRTPALIEDVRQALPSIKQSAFQRAGEAGVREVIGTRFAIYPQPERSPGEWGAWWDQYIDALSNVPWGALEGAMRAWVKLPTSEFLPKPGALLELAKGAQYKSALMYERAERAIRIADHRDEEAAKRKSILESRTDGEKKADTDSIMQMLGDFKARYEEKRAAFYPVKHAPPSTAGKPDAGGLTPMMRAAMARRNAD